MDNTSIGADAAKLAGLQVDTLQKMKNGHITLKHLRWFNNLTKKQRDALLRFNLDSLRNRKPEWTEQNGIVNFSVTSNGMTADEWIEYLEAEGFQISNYFKSLLYSSNFEPTRGVVTEVAILLETLCNGKSMAKIFKMASEKEFITLNIETICLIRYEFTDKEIKEMGLNQIVAMFRFTRDRRGLVNVCHLKGNVLCSDYCDNSDYGGWDDDCGFAFEIPKEDFRKEDCYIETVRLPGSFKGDGVK